MSPPAAVRWPALLALIALGCKEAPPPTQVMVVLDAERAAAREIRAVTIAVSGRAADQEEFGEAQSERFELTPTGWPIEVGVVPEHNDATREFRVVATAYGEGDERLSRVVAMGGYRKGEVRTLPMLFDARCIETKTVCDGEDMTCEQGDCIDVVNGVLLPYMEPHDGGRQTEAGVDAGGTTMPGAGGSDGGPGQAGAGGGAGTDAAVAVAPCSVDNGGCAADMQCSTDADGMVVCQTCPSGSIGSDGVCGPALIDLSVSVGQLSPAFDSRTTEYAAQLPLLVRRVELVVTAPSGTTLTIDGETVQSGQAWLTPDLPYAPRAFAVSVSDAAGAERVYSVVLERKGTQVSYLKASNADVEDDFGRSVAVEGDTVVVGAFYEDSGDEGIDANQSDNTVRDSGAVYVFDRSAGDAFSQIAYIKPDDPQTDGFFGSALDFEGDTLLVGAVGANGVVADGGAAYVFVREAGSWRQQAKLQPEDGVADDWFGVAVALQGDTALVAAPDRTTGAIYAYERTGDTWTLVQRFSQDNPRVGTRFGAALSLRGDRLLVGAPEDSKLVTQGGAAYVFGRSAGMWSQQQELRPSSSTARDWFGFAVAGDDTFVVVGTPQKNGEGLDTGAVYVFTSADGTWEQEQLLEPSSGHEYALFGSATLLTPEGFLLVGAQGEFDGGRGVTTPPAPSDEAAPYSGGVYVFRSEGQRFTADSYVKAENRGADDNFGYVFDVSADLLVIGSLFESSDARMVDGDASNNGRNQSGAAYVFR